MASKSIQLQQLSYVNQSCIYIFAGGYLPLLFHFRLIFFSINGALHARRCRADLKNWKAAARLAKCCSQKCVRASIFKVLTLQDVICKGMRSIQLVQHINKMWFRTKIKDRLIHWQTTSRCNRCQGKAAKLLHAVNQSMRKSMWIFSSMDS